MNTENISSNLDTYSLIIFFAVGIYCIYTYFKLRGATKLPEKSAMVLPPNESPSQCKDAPGYLGEICAKLLVLGIVITVLAIVEAVGIFCGFTPTWFMVAVNLLPLGAIVWYIIEYKRLIAKYWK